VKKPPVHKAWPAAPAPAGKSSGMNGDTVTLDDQKAKKAKGSDAVEAEAKAAAPKK